jgi:hypothetical protein
MKNTRLLNHQVKGFLTLAVVLIWFIRPQNIDGGNGWPLYAHDPHHSCLSGVPSQTPQFIRWSTPVDLNPQYSDNELFIHYGSPIITRSNTVIIPVKTGATDGFRIEAHRGSDGAMLWLFHTDFSLPPHAFVWTPICGIALTPDDEAVAVPGAGGTILLRHTPDGVAISPPTRLAFYGLDNYNLDPAAFNRAIQISTPITTDKHGNLYFGFVSSGQPLPGYPRGIRSGLARVDKNGHGRFTSAVAMSGDHLMQKVAYNCTPAFSIDGDTLYAAVNRVAFEIHVFPAAYLCALDSATLRRKVSAPLLDPRSTPENPLAALASDSASSTPTVGVDGDVYFGVLESDFTGNHDRGWLLHFDRTLTVSKLPSAFGWDDTASIVPARAVPSYQGPSLYLLLTKYNNYIQAGGNGRNFLALVDPNVSMRDPITGVTVMKAVRKVLGPTPDPVLGGVREWCINSAAIDPVLHCAVVNSEDGRVYNWRFDENKLTPGLTLAPPTGEAYTPTIIGPDRAVYAINNAQLFSCAAFDDVDLSSGAE